MTDPFDQLATPIEPQAPRPAFARALRARLVEALELDPLTMTPTIDLPGRKPMTTTHRDRDRSSDAGFQIEHGPRAGQRYVDGIWSAVAYRDPDAGIRFVTEVLGFEELVMVRGEDGRIVHSEYRWPEGGIVQIAGEDADNPFLPAPGGSGLYVITRDPQSVWERCQAAGVEVLRPPEEPHYDPGGMGFSVRDPEGNAWSFGTYVGGATD
ncbi:MAG: VOC family protein [Actinomycetota bacterium]